MVYENASQVDFRLESLPVVPLPQQVLFVTPDHFDVQYVINPHMEGNVGTVDFEKAREQWESLCRLYDSLGLSSHVLAGRPGLPDMVFCANQTLPFNDPANRSKGVILSRMHSEHRQKEVSSFDQYFRSIGYSIVPLDDTIHDFEGMGDAIWHPGRYLLWGGFGFRSSPEAYRFISESLGVPALMLKLEDPDFYHLDTCFSVLDESTVLIFPGAFDRTGLDLIRSVFETVLEAPEDESRALFACNAHCPDRRHVVIQAGCDRTISLLRSAGFEPIEVRTEEFLKAGGSVFCMKQMFW